MDRWKREGVKRLLFFKSPTSYLSMLYGLFETGLEPPDKMVTVPLITNLFYEFL